MEDSQRPQGVIPTEPPPDLTNLMTIVYMCIQETLIDLDGMNLVRRKLRKYPTTKLLLKCGANLSSGIGSPFDDVHAFSLGKAPVARGDLCASPSGMSPFSAFRNVLLTK